MAAQASAAPPADAARQRPVKLVTATRHVSQEPSYLFMCTNNIKWDKNESLFKAADGSLVYRLENKNGVFKETKVLYDAAGNTVLTAKKFPLSLAKWTVTLPSGAVAAKTRTISGLAKYGVEVDVPGAPRNGSASTFTIVPELSNSKVIIMQNNGKGKDESLVCVAQYGETVVMGMISAAVQDWSYHIGLEPGADAALACCLLVIYTELIEWNALGGAFGMN